MTIKSWFEKKHASKEYELVYQQESAVLEATEAILQLMEKTGKSKSDLAKALGKSKPHVTQALSGGRNMTLRTFASFAWACGYTLHGFELRPIESGQIRGTVDLVQRPDEMGLAARQRWIEQVAKEVDRLAVRAGGEELEQELRLAA
jgi:transcriptional regulator with XRE-family HTH domain